MTGCRKPCRRRTCRIRTAARPTTAVTGAAAAAAAEPLSPPPVARPPAAARGRAVATGRAVGGVDVRPHLAAAPSAGSGTGQCASSPADRSLDRDRPLRRHAPSRSPARRSSAVSRGQPPARHDRQSVRRSGPCRPPPSRTACAGAGSQVDPTVTRVPAQRRRVEATEDRWPARPAARPIGRFPGTADALVAELTIATAKQDARRTGRRTSMSISCGSRGESSGPPGRSVDGAFSPAGLGISSRWRGPKRVNYSSRSGKDLISHAGLPSLGRGTTGLDPVSAAGLCRAGIRRRRKARRRATVRRHRVSGKEGQRQWPSSPPASSWKAASTSGIRPDGGTRR